MSALTKILLPIDVTHVHPEFLPLLNELISLKGANVHLLYVKEEFPAMENMLRTLSSTPAELDKQVVSKATEVLTKVKESLEQLGATVTLEIVGGFAAMMIERVAKDEGFSLTVVPPGSKPSLDKHLLGRVSAKVVHHAPGTVLLLRGEPQSKLDNVVIGLDGSEHALRALREAVALFDLKEKGTKVTLVNVLSINPMFAMVSSVESLTAIESNLEMTGEALLAEGERILAESGMQNYEMKLKEGKTADALIEAAKELKASLIVVGCQGKGAVEHFLMGSTSTRLADHAHCAVAVFKSDHGKAN